MRYVTIGRYQFSAILLLVAAIVSPLAFATTYYIWSSKTIPLTVEEPLTVLDFPESLRLHPGQNSTIDIIIANSANINYEISITISLSDVEYQESFVQVGKDTYLIAPGNNTISAWIAISKDAAPSTQQLAVDFIRL